MRTTPDLPHAVLKALADALGPAARIEAVTPVGGGDINRAGVVRTDSGEHLFVKWNETAPDGMFEAEADGLSALADVAGEDLVVPRVRALGEANDVAWLLMEHVGMSGPSSGTAWAARLGRGLAEMHGRASGSSPIGEAAGADAAAWGWAHDNFIGRLPQKNTPTEGWAEFWRDLRIGPQVRTAVDAGLISGTARGDMGRLLDRIAEALVGASADGPSLLHGDLWGGNVMEAEGGRAAIYDPAVYRGHREVDLAMSELFGFPSAFMPAYHEAWPVDAEYEAHRRDLYQLYYLLVHVNLFGGGYVAPALAAARRVLAAI